VNRLLVWRLVPALAVAVILLVLTATVASAHATLTSSDPPAGASVSTLPSAVVLRFSDPVQGDGASVMLQTSSGPVALTNVRLVAPNVLVADIPGARTLHGAVEFAW
jgi:copper resistance protein C